MLRVQRDGGGIQIWGCAGQCQHVFKRESWKSIRGKWRRDLRNWSRGEEPCSNLTVTVCLLFAKRCYRHFPLNRATHMSHRQGKRSQVPSLSESFQTQRTELQIYFGDLNIFVNFNINTRQLNRSEKKYCEGKSALTEVCYVVTVVSRGYNIHLKYMQGNRSEGPNYRVLRGS